MDKFSIHSQQTAVLIIDIQDRLAAAMPLKDQITNNCLILIEAAKQFQIPVVLTEQYPKGLGRTLDEIQRALPGVDPFEKLSFNCCDEAGFLEKIRGLGKKKLLLAGMETHICILQTALGLLREGFDIQIVRDAVCSRTKTNFKTGLGTLDRAGAVITSTETVIFQLLQKAGSDAFKTLSKLIK